MENNILIDIAALERLPVTASQEEMTALEKCTFSCTVSCVNTCTKTG